MSVACPNKKSPEWKSLVDNIGELNGYKVFIQEGDSVPTMDKVNEYINLYNSSNIVNSNLAALGILQSNKAEQVFAKGKKNGWNLNKILTELQVPKEQKSIILDKGIKDREEIITSLLAENSFVVEVNVTKQQKDYALNNQEQGELAQTSNFNYNNNDYSAIYDFDEYGDDFNSFYKNKKRISQKEYDNARKEYLKKTLQESTSFYSNLTVPGGTNYTENEIATPDIVPNIKGHAQFSTDNGIGWFRSDDKVSNFKEAYKGELQNVPSDILEEMGYTSDKTRRILEVQSDLFQKGRDSKDLVATNEMSKLRASQQLDILDTDDSGERYFEKEGKYFIESIDGIEEITAKQYEQLTGIGTTKEFNTKNQFLQLLNKKNNWVTFFVKSIIQDSVKKGYEKVLFPSGDTAAKIEGHQTLEEFKKQKEARIKKLEELIKNPKSSYSGGRLISGEKLSKKEGVSRLGELKYLEYANPMNQEFADLGTTEFGYTQWYNKDGFYYTELIKDEFYKIPEKLIKKEIQLANEESIQEIQNEYNTEIKTLKQELADVESGQTQLSSIAKFYEETVANILKKNGFSPVEITDEYGNKWNEVTLEKRRDLSSIFLNKDKKTKFDGKYFEGNPKELNKTELKRLFGISNYLRLSDPNVNVIKGRIDKFNTRFNTSHSLPSYKIAETNSYNIDLVVNTNPRNEKLKRQNTIRRLDPDNRTPKDQDIIDGQMSLFSLENSSLDAEQQRKTKAANDRLEKILTNDLNVSIEFLKDFKAKYGVDANGVADIAKKLIEVNNMEYLPEEAAHMIFEMISDSQLQEGLLNLARQSEEYKQVWKDYGETYNNDELKIAKETAGKLLAKAFVHTADNPVINNESESMIRRLLKSAQAIWNKIQKMLNSDPSIKNNLNEVFNDLALGIYSNTVELDQNKPAERNVFFSKKADDNAKKVEDAKQIVESAILTLKNKIRVNKNKSTDEDAKSNKYVANTKEILRELEKELENAQYANAIQGALNKINKEFNGSDIDEVADSFKMKQRLDELESKAADGEISLNKLARELRVMYQHYSAYRPIIQKLTVAFGNDNQFKQDMLETLTEEQYKDLERQAYIINGRLNYLENKYFQLGNFLTTKLSDVYSKQENKVRDSNGNLVSNTVLIQDDTLLAKRAFAAAESDDELLRLMDTINKNQKQIARSKHLDYTTEVLNKYDKLKDKLDNFDFILHKNKKGNITGRFLTKENNPTAYNKLTKDQKEYLDFLYNSKLELEKGLPKRFRTGDLLPQYRKDLLERIKNDPKNVGNTILDLVKAREDDTDFGIKDELGNKINFLPIYGTMPLDNVEDLSKDITSSMLLHSMYIMEYKEMSKVIDSLEMMKDLAGNRTVITGTKVNANELKDLTVEQIKQKYDTVQGKTSHNFKWMEDFFKMQFYGQMKKEKEFSANGNFKIPGIDMEFNWVKTLDTFGRYVGLNSLGGNIFSGINNVVLGRLVTNIEGIVGDFYSLKHLYSADKELANPMLLDDVGRKIPTHKAHIWARYRNVMQQYGSDIYNINADRKTKAGQLIDTNLPFILASSGEFLIQMRSSIALAKSIKLKDKDGNKINFYDAFDIVDNKMILKKGLTVDGKNKLFGYNRQGTTVTEQDVMSFERLQDRINQKLHGIYNEVDKSTVQQFALGRLAVMFRKFLVPTIRRRFGKAKFNEDMGEVEEGYYKSLARFIGYKKNELTLTRAQLLGLVSKENLTAEEEMQINNLRRSLVEIGTFLGLLVLTSFVLDDLEPDDDDWALNMFIYQTNRLYTEVAAFTPSPLLIKEFTTIVKSPAAAVNQLEAVSRLFNHVIDSDSWTEELDRGSYEGFTKLEKSGLQLIPMEKNIRSWFNPKEKNNWFDRN